MKRLKASGKLKLRPIERAGAVPDAGFASGGDPAFTQASFPCLRYDYFGQVAFVALDVPLFVVADTLSLPYDEVVVHCTINRRKPDEDFAESIRQFVDEWTDGLEQNTTLFTA